MTTGISTVEDVAQRLFVHALSVVLNAYLDVIGRFLCRNSHLAALGCKLTGVVGYGVDHK